MLIVEKDDYTFYYRGQITIKDAFLCKYVFGYKRYL